jgi:DNA-binding response OmpR family regulator
MQEELRQQYTDSLQDRLDSLKSLVKELRAGKVEALEQIRMIAHSLYGSGTTFGFPEITAASAKVEHASEAEMTRHLAELAVVLKSVIDKAKISAPFRRAMLLIEDDQDTAGLIRSLVAAQYPELQIDVAGSAKVAQEFLVKQAYSIIVLDLVLPDRDGRDVLREIRIDFQLQTPVLVLTGVNKDVVRVECMSLGADKVLLKPFEEDTLLQALKLLLDKSTKPQLALVPKGNEQHEADSAGRVKIDLSGKTLLLAEDDVVQAKLLQQRLVQEGLAVQHVNNGREAMAALRTKEFSIIILDVKMPLFTGFEVLERIRGELGLKTVPVIMLTAVGSEADIIRGYDLGANDYILKPFNPVQVIARVKSLLK